MSIDRWRSTPGGGHADRADVGDLGGVASIGPDGVLFEINVSVRADRVCLDSIL